MNLFCIGISHRTAPLEVRESVWYSNEEVAQLLPGLRDQLFREAAVVSTCNRTELYGVAANDELDTEATKRFLIAAKQANGLASPEHFYTLQSHLAAKHLFNVSAGIDSMVLGDVQILSQMKDAFQLAQQTKSTSTFLNRLFTTAFHVGKRVRTETEIGEGAVSVSYAAVELAGKIFNDLRQRKALLVGTGETGKLTAKHLIGKEIGKLYLANRTRERAEEVASVLGGTVVDYADVPKFLAEVDIAVTAVQAQNFIIVAETVQRAMKARGNNPLCIIDIGVPRNVDPAVNRIDNVFMHDIDTLNRVVDRNLEKRRAEVPTVQKIVHEELLNFHHWHQSLQAAPTIQDLREQFEVIRRDEVEKNINRFAPENRELVEIITKRIVNKILHTPTINLKGGPDGEDSLHKISTIRNLFGLGHRIHRTARPSHDHEQ